jgi:RNA polymerase sigma-70 factor (sigma-E family)
VRDFEQFFDAEYDPMVRSLTLALGDHDAAEDAAQEGFSRAHVRWAAVAAMDRPATWVYVVAVRYEGRRLRRHKRSDIPQGGPLSGPDEATAVADRAVVFGLLAQLTSRQRRAVLLRYHADLTLDQIADALGCSVGTVKATLHQAVQRLRAIGLECDDAVV